MFRLLLMAMTLLSASGGAFARPHPAHPGRTQRAQAHAPSEGGALGAAVRDLCGRDIALLGEADHGDGRTVAFKAALVRMLVTRCGYNAVFFEANHYDFLEFADRLRSGQAVSPDLIASAVGGLWRFDREFQPLLPFLFDRARAGRLVLGGLDDQVGSLGSFYGNDEMPSALAANLADSRNALCRRLLDRRTHGADGTHAEPERSETLRCLAAIAEAVRGRRDADRATRAAQLSMIASLQRLITRDRWATPGDMTRYSEERDRSMYLNFLSLVSQLPPHRRIIVWAANAHIARDATPSGQYADTPNMGAFVREAYGGRAFSLGFTALGGTHYWTPREPSRPIAPAAAGSLEALALARSRADAVYLDRERLAALGEVPGSLFQHRPASARWSRVVDAVVVFRAEEPAQHEGDPRSAGASAIPSP